MFFTQADGTLADYEVNDKIEYFEDILHDIKTQMSIMTALILKIEGGAGNSANVMGHTAEMKKSFNKILNLITDASKGQLYKGGDYIPKYVNYEMVYLTESIVNSVTAIADRKNIEIVFDTNIEEKVMAIDKLMFERMMLNLLSNALKFSHADSLIQVIFTDNENYITIDIKDSGVGINRESVESIFFRYEKSEEFFNENGSGIGLDIVRRFAQALNGSITVCKNTEEKGTVMRLLLPSFVAEYDGDKEEDNLSLFNFFPE